MRGQRQVWWMHNSIHHLQMKQLTTEAADCCAECCVDRRHRTQRLGVIPGKNCGIKISTHLHLCQRRRHALRIQRAQRGQQRPRAFSAELLGEKVLQRWREGWAGRQAGSG